MAKRNFKEAISQNRNDVSEVTKAFFSLPAEEKEEEAPAKPKRKYTKFTAKENKTHTVTLRLTETQYNKLLADVESTASGTLTAYILKKLGLDKGAK